MRRIVSILLLLTLLAVLPVTVQPAHAQIDLAPPTDTSTPADSRRLMIVGAGAVFGMIAFNYALETLVPHLPTLSPYFGRVHAAFRWVALQGGRAWAAIAGSAAPVTIAAAPPAAVAAPAAAAMAAPAAGVGLVAMRPAIPARVVSQVVDTAHGLGFGAGIVGALAAHYVFAVIDAIGTPEQPLGEFADGTLWSSAQHTGTVSAVATR